MSEQTITGGCQCGAIRYETSEISTMGGHCHCNDCKKASGAGHVSAMFVSKDNLKITGETAVYVSKGDSGHDIKRHFCPTCGGRLFGEPEVMPGFFGIMVGSLDNPELFQPNLQLYTKRRTSWDHLQCD